MEARKGLAWGPRPLRAGSCLKGGGGSVLLLPGRGDDVAGVQRLEGGTRVIPHDLDAIESREIEKPRQLVVLDASKTAKGSILHGGFPLLPGKAQPQHEEVDVGDVVEIHEPQIRRLGSLGGGALPGAMEVE